MLVVRYELVIIFVVSSGDNTCKRKCKIHGFLFNYRVTKTANHKSKMKFFIYISSQTIYCIQKAFTIIWNSQRKYRVQVI